MAADIFTIFLNTLRAPLKETSAVTTGLTGLIAKACSRLWEDAQNQIKGAFPKFFKGREELSLWAEERGMSPIQGESQAQYAKRAAQAFGFLSFAGTRKGIERIISQVTPKPFIIRELYAENWILNAKGALLGEDTILNTQYSSFVFVIEFQGLTLSEKEYLEALIALYKPAHTVFRIETDILDDWLLGAPQERLGISTYLEP